MELTVLGSFADQYRSIESRRQLIVAPPSQFLMMLFVTIVCVVIMHYAPIVWASIVGRTQCHEERAALLAGVFLWSRISIITDCVFGAISVLDLLMRAYVLPVIADLYFRKQSRLLAFVFHQEVRTVAFMLPALVHAFLWYMALRSNTVLSAYQLRIKEIGLLVTLVGLPPLIVVAFAKLVT